MGVKNIRIRYLSFQNCSAREAVLTFHGGKRVSLLYVNLTNFQGAGIRCIDVQETTNLTHVAIVSATYTNYTNEFVYTNSNGSLNINGSIFSNHITASNFSRHALIFTSHNNIAAKILIEFSTFSNNYGGNLKITINGTQIQNQVTINHSNLTGGKADKGGGLFLSLYEIPSLSQCLINKHEWSVVLIEAVKFESNQAHVAGGGLFLQQKNHPNVSNSKAITIKKCTFNNNSLNGDSRGGVALHSITYILQGTLTQVTPQYKPKISNCTFTKNHVVNTTEASGNGVIFINKNEYFGIKDITVSHNKCSAILAVTSNLLFEGTSELSHNHAASGGGLLLCKNGILYFRPHTILNIVNNKAIHTGGGICVESQCLQTEPRCFYQFDNVTDKSSLKTIHIHVTNNTAKHAGDNLFGGLVDFCYRR